MAQFDLPLAELERYAPDIRTPEDLDAFWETTLQEARAHPLEARFEPAGEQLRALEAFDVTYGGFGGQPVRGWLILPRHRDGPIPCVVEYIGYGGGRGFPTDWLLYASAGFAHLVMDTRGQGSGGSRKGDTPDPEGSGPQTPGFMTRGILDPRTYYYRRVYTDAVRAIEAARAHPAVDGSRIVVAGGSQGGGIAIAAAALADGVAGLMPDVPFLCHMERASRITDAMPYAELQTFCKTHRDRAETVFRTLSYFDGAVLAPRITAPALFSVALMDAVCPPSTVFAAYNRLAGPRDVRVYPYNGHEGGDGYQAQEKLAFLRRLWG